MIVRYPDWRMRLLIHFRAASKRLFCWGTFDCCVFVSDAVRSMSGTDLLLPFRGRYATKRSAYLTLRRYAGGGIARAASRALSQIGQSEIPPSAAAAGDVVVYQAPGGDALGIVDLGGRYIASVTEAGLVFLECPVVTHAWKV